MRTGTAISTAIHAGVLLWVILVFDVKTLDDASVHSIPVDFISATDFSKMTEGVKNAKPLEAPKPLVEKQGDSKPVEEQTEKLTEKQEIAPQKDATPPPPAPEPQKAEAKPDPKPEAKPEKAEAKPEPKTEDAEALKKDEKQKPKDKPDEAKAAAKPTPLPQKKPDKPQPKFDPTQVAALLDKRDPQRRAATGETINRTASLGAPGANAPQLSQSELDALRARLMQLWNPPIGISNAGDMVIRIRIQLRPDGTLAGPPAVMTSGKGAMFESARDSAVRAIFRGQPFNMLRPQTYETWKDIEVTFDPRDMLSRG